VTLNDVVKCGVRCLREERTRVTYVCVHEFTSHMLRQVWSAGTLHAISQSVVTPSVPLPSTARGRSTRGLAARAWRGVTSAEGTSRGT